MGAETPALLLYLGHHKCATKYVGAIARDLCALVGRPCAIVDSSRDFRSAVRGMGRRRCLVGYGNARHRVIREFGDYRGFHMVRDPRDIIVSAYFSHLHSHSAADWPALVEHRRELSSMDKRDGLLQEMEFSRQVLVDMQEWDYEDPEIFELRMEDMIDDPEKTLGDAFTFLGLLTEESDAAARGGRLNWLHARSRGRFPVRGGGPPHASREQFRAVLHAHRFSTKAGGRRQGQEDVKSHYRKGVPGDWRNHLEDVHVEQFRAHHNELLLKLGYETRADWS